MSLLSYVSEPSTQSHPCAPNFMVNKTLGSAKFYGHVRAFLITTPDILKETVVYGCTDQVVAFCR